MKLMILLGFDHDEITTKPKLVSQIVSIIESSRNQIDRLLKDDGDYNGNGDINTHFHVDSKDLN